MYTFSSKLHIKERLRPNPNRKYHWFNSCLSVLSAVVCSQILNKGFFFSFWVKMFVKASFGSSVFAFLSTTAGCVDVQLGAEVQVGSAEVLKGGFSIAQLCWAFSFWVWDEVSGHCSQGDAVEMCLMVEVIAQNIIASQQLRSGTGTRRGCCQERLAQSQGI